MLALKVGWLQMRVFERGRKGRMSHDIPQYNHICTVGQSLGGKGVPKDVGGAFHAGKASRFSQPPQVLLNAVG